MKKIIFGIVFVVVVFVILVSAKSGVSNEPCVKQRNGFHEPIIVINETVIEEAPAYPMDGFIFVNNGTLIFRNTSIAFYSDATNHYYIIVENNSTLVLENVFLTTERKIIAPYLNLTVTISNSTLTVKNSILAYPGWLTVTNSSIRIENSTITSRLEGGYAPLMFFENSNVILARAKIENYYEIAHTVTMTNAHWLSAWPSEGVIVPPNWEVNVTSRPGFYSDALNRSPTSRLSSVMLVVDYEAEENYTGNNYFEWSIGGVDFYNCSNPWESPYPELREYEICPKYNGTKYDLWARGVRDLADLASIYIRFINNDLENDTGSNVTVKEITIISACENDLTFVNSTLCVFDSYIDVDFQSSDIDPVKAGDQRPVEFLYLGTAFPDELKDVYMEDFGAQHNVIRLVDNSIGYFYNITVDGVAQEDSDPCFVADNTSKAFIGRWVNLTVLDEANGLLENVGVEVIKKNITVDPPLEPVLEYINKTSTNYNFTDKNGKVLLALHSDLIAAPPSWPNSHISLNYKLIGRYLGYESSKNISLPSFPNILAENNTITTSLVFGQLYIDVYPQIEISNTTPTEGDIVWINATVYNTGTLDAKNVTVKFYVNTTIINQTQLLVPANSSKFINGTTWLALPGSYNVRVVVDEENKTIERNEFNNEISRNIYVFTKPDLNVELDFVTPAIVNTTVDISVTVRNTGERSAPNFILSIWLGNEWQNESLSLEGASYIARISYKNFSLPGDYTISVYADSSKIISESNESNNEISKFLEVRTLPDLEISKITLSSDVEDTVFINATVRNNGGTEASNIIVKFYLSATEIGYVQIAQLLPYSETLASISYTLPAGTHIIRAIADPDNQIDEGGKEANNELSRTFTLYTKPDLYVEKIVFSNLNPIVGDAIEVTAYIANLGEANVTADIIFYCNEQWLGTTKGLAVLGKNTSTATTAFTAPSERTITIKVKISNSIPSESSTANNELSKTLSIYLPDVFDKVIDEGFSETFECNYTHTGHVVVRGILTISNSTFSFLTTDYDWHLAVLGNGKLILQNATLTSNYKLQIYLYDNSSIEAYNATIDASILGEGDANIVLESCIFNGSFSLSCYSLSMKQTSVQCDFSVTAKNITVTNSNITGTNNVVSDTFFGENSTFANSLALCGNATLINVTGTITSKVGGVILMYWLAEIDAKDIVGSSLENVSVKISRDGALEVDKATDEEGRLVIALLAYNITSYGAKFLGNYELTAEYKAPTRNYTEKLGFQLTSNLLLEIVFPDIIILPQSLEINITVEPTAVTADEYLTVSGTVWYNIGSKPAVKNTNLTITIAGISETTATDEYGTYSCELRAPQGATDVKIAVTDSVFGIYGESSVSITVLAPPAPPEKPVDIIPIIIAIVVIVVVVIICFIKRKLLKAYLIVLKAKLKKEEFTECTECSKNIPSLLKKCPYCDTELGEEKEKAEEERAKCSECGALIPVTAKKCPKCGAKFEE